LSKDLPLEVIAQKYLREGFLLDLIILLPLGGIFSLIDTRLKFLWLIKAIRIKDLMMYMSERQFNQMVDFYIEYRQGNNLEDPAKRNEINEDLIYIEDKIHLRSMFKIIRLLAIVVFVVYFVGQYWLIYTQIVCMFKYGLSEEDHNRELLNF
jgi:hypothetical protein